MTHDLRSSPTVTFHAAWGFRKATFLNSQDRKVAFLNSPPVTESARESWAQCGAEVLP